MEQKNANRAKERYQLPTDETGMMLNPGNPDKCLGNGEFPKIECRCDECDYLGECYPEHLTINRKQKR